jgi:hypothetical protein
MAKEHDSMRALAAEAEETVVLTQHLYSCVVKDARHISGEFRALIPPGIPASPETSKEPSPETPKELSPKR